MNAYTCFSESGWIRVWNEYGMSARSAIDTYVFANCAAFGSPSCGEMVRWICIGETGGRKMGMCILLQ